MKGKKDKIKDDQTKVIHFPRLRAEDWQVPVVEACALRDGGRGIALTSQREGEEVYQQMNFCKGAMAVLTPKPIAQAESQKVEVLVRKPNGTTDCVRKFLTNVGDTPVDCDVKEEVEACTLNLKNKTRKVVLQFQRAYADPMEYAYAKEAPRLSFEKWLKDFGLRDAAVNINTPFVRRVGASEWLEAIVFVSELSLGQFLTKSGQKGMFVNPFFDQDMIDDGCLKKLWFEPGTTLQAALSRTARHSNMVIGLVCNPLGLGARVNVAHLEAMKEKLLTPSENERMSKRDGQKFYQASKIPPWVDYDDFRLQVKNQWNWEIDLVRIVSGFGTKTFIVRSQNPPPKEMFIIDYHKVPVQLAPERPKPQAERLQLQRNTKPEVEKREVTSRARAPATGEVPNRRKVDTKRATPAASSLHDSMSDVGITMALIRIQQQLDDMNARQTKQETELKEILRRKDFVMDGIENLEDVDVDIPSDSNDEMLLTDIDSKSAAALRKRKAVKKVVKKASS